MSDNYYSVLEVSKNASQQDIKKSYRKLSMKWHPDKNKSPEAELNFKKISEAYTVLSDENSRRNYDMTLNGIDGISVDLPDIFKVFMGGVPNNGFSGANMFSGAGIFPGMMNAENLNMFNEDSINIEKIFNNLRKPTPIINNITITLEEAYTGVSIPLAIERTIVEYNEKSIENETVYISIPPGVDDNEIIITKNMGNIVNNNKGDIKTFIKINNSSIFSRKGLDLYFTKEITLKEALCGFSFDIPHLNKNNYKINNQNGTIINPTYQKQIPNLGMIRKNKKGSMIINFLIIFPETISSDNIKKLQEIL